MTPKTGILAFCGSKGSGKSTSAEMFKELYTGPMEELAFAGRLKEVCSQVFELPMENFLDPKLKEKELDKYINLTPLKIEQVFRLFDVPNQDYDTFIRPHLGKVFETPRQVLQYVGTELLQKVNRAVHSNQMLKLKSPEKLTVVTDLRFFHEYELLKTGPNFFIPVLIKNDGASLIAASDTHPSETDLRKFERDCLVIENNGTLSELREKLKKFIEEYYG